MSKTKKNLWDISKRGRGQPQRFNNPEEMLSIAYEYFAWCESNPIVESKPFSSQGEIVYGEVSKMRAMTVEGLCVFLNICRSTWFNYQNKPEFLDITSHINDIMREQKFTGAAAGVLNANIVARDLGLVDKTSSDDKVEYSGKIETNFTIGDDEIKDMINKMQ